MNGRLEIILIIQYVNIETQILYLVTKILLSLLFHYFILLFHHFFVYVSCFFVYCMLYMYNYILRLYKYVNNFQNKCSALRHCPHIFLGPGHNTLHGEYKTCFLAGTQ